jgi:protein-disulfide isomerase
MRDLTAILATVLLWVVIPYSAIAASDQPLTKEQGDEILSELRAIRSLLEKQAQASPGAPRPATPAVPQTITLPDTVGHATLGSSDAPVTIVEYTDLQCPYCARFSAQTLPALRKNYIDTGKVRLVSRDLPLGFHQYAVPAAVAARCAGEQGKYWEFREQIFQRQKELAGEPYDAIAATLGLDAGKFTRCRQDPARAKTAETDRAGANALGITGTPTFLIGRSTRGAFVGEKLSGAQPLSAFEQRINALLSSK